MQEITNITDGARLLPSYKPATEGQIRSALREAAAYMPEGVTWLEVQTVLAKDSDDRGEGPARFHVVILQGRAGSSAADFLTLPELLVFLRGVAIAWQMAA